MSLAPFVGTPPNVVEEMLELAQLKAGEILYDLGCGDGRIIIMAAQRFKANAVGVELDDGRFKRCSDKIRELGLEDQVMVVHGDLMKVDLTPADVVTLYLLTSSNEKVKPYLEHYLKRGARVVSHDFEIPGWKPIIVKEVKETWGSHKIFVYKKG
jgi:cyclopropane fatty-acyl-phospholipid synthase-like methyltransferase